MDVNWAFWLVMLLAHAACATGAPVGGRALVEGIEPGHLVPGATPRTVPVDGGPSATSAPHALPEKSRELVLKRARAMVGQRKMVVDGRRFSDDCTGLIKAAFWQLPIDFDSEAKKGDNGVTAIFRFASAHGRVFGGGAPIPGDLVFFRETYDVNRDGRINDGLTHIGIVDAVDAVGTVFVIHRVQRGVVRYKMNLQFKEVRFHPESGVEINDYLRAPGWKQRNLLTSQLFAGYATVLPTP